MFSKTNESENSTSIVTSLVTAYIIGELDSSTAYSIQIKAVNKAGSGPSCRLNAQTLLRGNILLLFYLKWCQWKL